MRIVYFTHSLTSCWNNGNAHFQRGALRALGKLGHDVVACEPIENWSRQNLLADQGRSAVDAFGGLFPTLAVERYAQLHDLPHLLDAADLVIVHEWNDPALVAEIGRLRRQASFTLLFHDTHHRAVSDPDAIRHFDLSCYDGVLAFGATLARVYESWGWGDRVFVWHEAADTDLFHPPSHVATQDWATQDWATQDWATQDWATQDWAARNGAVWVGNWGDGERSTELESFLLAPAHDAGVKLDVHGVRYPDVALEMLKRYGAWFHGWLANAGVPALFARYRVTVHVPRRYYTQMLPGIPTIRVFEALACGLPLITSPWQDTENLFEPGTDYLVAHDSDAMARHMRAVSHDTALAAHLAEAGLSSILARHSCDIRAAELLGIAGQLTAPAVAA